MGRRAIVTKNTVVFEDIEDRIQTPEELEDAYRATIPNVVSMRQAVIYLIRNNLIDMVNTVVASQGDEAVATWEKSHEVQRVNPLLNYVLDSQGYSEEDKDQMFIAASKL